MRSLALLLIGLIGGCATGENHATGSLDSLEWLLGDWQRLNERAIRTESWVQVAPGVFRGVGRSNDPETGAERFSESLLLYATDDSITYMARVAENPLPVPFVMTESSDTHAVFENPSHDFPRRLRYQLTQPCELVITVDDGAGDGFTIEFQRTTADCAD